MLTIRQPDQSAIDKYRETAIATEPTYPAEGDFHESTRTAVVGSGAEAFSEGKLALRGWRMHNLAGVLVDPVALQPDETVVLRTRALGIWILFACRITSIVDELDRFGFTYATLPDHPEQGYETFLLRQDEGRVEFSIDAESRPGNLVSRLAGPVGGALQRKYANTYLAAM